jgi:hypothetical protein
VLDRAAYTTLAARVNDKLLRIRSVWARFSQSQTYLEDASIFAKMERVASTMVCGASYGIM